MTLFAEANPHVMAPCPLAVRQDLPPFGSLSPKDRAVARERVLAAVKVNMTSEPRVHARPPSDFSRAAIRGRHLALLLTARPAPTFAARSLAYLQERWIDADTSNLGEHQAVLSLLMRTLSPARDGDTAGPTLPAGSRLAVPVAAASVCRAALALDAALTSDGIAGPAGDRASSLLHGAALLCGRAFTLAESGLAAWQSRGRGGGAAPPTDSESDPDADLASLATMLRGLAGATLSLVQHHALLGQRGSPAQSLPTPPASSSYTTTPGSLSSSTAASPSSSAGVAKETSIALTVMAEAIEKALTQLLAAAVERATAAPPRPPSDFSGAPPPSAAALCAASAALAFVLNGAADPERILAASSGSGALEAAAGPEGRLGSGLARLAHSAWRCIETLLRVGAALTRLLSVRFSMFA